MITFTPSLRSYPAALLLLLCAPLAQGIQEEAAPPTLTPFQQWIVRHVPKRSPMPMSKTWIRNLYKVEKHASYDMWYGYEFRTFKRTKDFHSLTPAQQEEAFVACASKGFTAYAKTAIRFPYAIMALGFCLASIVSFAMDMKSSYKGWFKPLYGLGLGLFVAGGYWLAHACYPLLLIEDAHLPVETLFMSLRHKMSWPMVQQILNLLEESYTRYEEEDRMAALEEARRCCHLFIRPSYQPLEVDDALLAKALAPYPAALQEQVRTLLTAMQEVSKVLAQGGTPKRLVIGIEDPLGVEAQHLIEVLAKACGLPPSMALSLGGNPQALLGSANKSGALTQALQDQAMGNAPNAHLVMAASSRCMPLLGPSTTTYCDPSLGKGGPALPLSPILLVVTPSLPQGKEALLQGYTFTLSLGGPHQEAHYHALAQAYLEELLQAYGPLPDAPAAATHGKEGHPTLHAIAAQAYASKATRQALEQAVHHWFLDRRHAQPTPHDHAA